MRTIYKKVNKNDLVYILNIEKIFEIEANNMKFVCDKFQAKNKTATKMVYLLLSLKIFK